MKKLAMWAFIFAALAASTYSTIALSKDPVIVQAYHGEQYAFIFKVDVREPIHYRWFTRYRTVRYNEVCPVSKSLVTSLTRRDIAAQGRDRNGITYYLIKNRAEERVRALLTDEHCTIVKRPFWKFFIFHGGGTVS